MDIRGFEVVSQFEDKDIAYQDGKQRKARATILNVRKP